jgi:hypothetical protein
MNCAIVAKKSGALLAAARGYLHRATGRYAVLHISTRARFADYDTPVLVSKSRYIPYILVLASFAFGSSMGNNRTVAAEAEKKLSSTKSSKTTVSENPLLSGVSERDIQAFVEQVLSDSSINVKGIPDVLEAELYRMTVRLVLDMIYSSIGAMHGAEFLAGHRIELKRRRETADEAATSRLFLKENTGIDDAILEQVADRLLHNPAINYTAVPDFVERQIYGNCLKLVFRLLDTLANTFCINICGHELRIYFDPIKPSMVDLDHLAEITPIPTAATQSSESRINVQVLNAQLSSNTNSVFQQQVLLAVYTLVLGIIDDVLANSEIKLLYDRVSFDVVAGGDNGNGSDGSDAVDQKMPSTSQSGTVAIGTVATSSAIFAAGVAAGVAAGAVATFFLGSRR